MQKIPTFLLALCATLNAFAQTEVHGDAQLTGNIGHGAPFEAVAKLDIHNKQLQLKPTLGYTRISHNGSAEVFNQELILAPSGHRYTGHFRSQDEGNRYVAGITGSYLFTPFTQVAFGLDFNRSLTQSIGSRAETLFTSASDIQTKYWGDTDSDDRKTTFGANATLRHTFSSNGDQLSVGYNHKSEELNSLSHFCGTGTPNDGGLNNIFNRSLDLDIQTHNHSLQADYRHLFEGHSHWLLMGLRYDQRDIDVSDYQQIDRHGRQEDFDHHLRTIAAFAEYHLTLPQRLDLTARLEYQHSQIDYRQDVGVDFAEDDYSLSNIWHSMTDVESPTRYFNDVVPMFRARYTFNPSHNLTLLYAMRLIRPDAKLLLPGQFIEPFAITNGNPDLVSTHANNVQLTYGYTNQGLRFNTTLQHIFADDGFNAIWIVRDDLRNYTWGNQGIRRAWGLTPDLEWSLSPATKLNARATLLWDKRIAEAIHMAKEHWGITTHLAISQRIVKSLTANAYFDYSEGNTIDLYSHSGRANAYGIELDYDILRNNRLHASLAYHYTEYAPTIITQGMYTGTESTFPDRHALQLLDKYARIEGKVSWKF